MVIYILLGINIISIFVCHFVAKRKGKKPVFWGLMGAIFGPLVIPFAMASSAPAESPS